MAKSKAQQEHDAALAEAYELGRANLVDFRTIFLAADDDVSPAPFHYRWSDLLLNGTTNIVVEGYRESAKTQYIIRSHTLYRLVYPSKAYDYIVNIESNQTRAESRLNEITRIYLANPALCNNLVRVNKNTGGIFDVDVTDTDGKEINVRIEAYGKGANIRGLVYGTRRPKLVVIDDPQDLEDSQSDTVIEKDWEWFMSDVYFLGDKTRVFLIGNNLGEKCIVERVKKDAESLGYTVEIVPVLDAEGNPTWPSKNTIEKIEAEKEAFRKIGKLEIWLREKMCQAIDPETQLFKREYFKYIDKEPAGLSKFILVDPAISKSDKSCYTALVCWGVNAENHWFLCDVEYGHFDPGETMDAFFRMVSKHRPIVSGIEDVGYQKALQWLVNQEMIKRKIFTRVEPLKHHGKAKEIRIQGLQPRYKCGTIWHVSGLHGLAEYESELLMFRPGVNSRVDLIDAAAYGDQIIIAPTRSVIRHNRPTPKRGAL
jgi:hypothetical protein